MNTEAPPSAPARSPSSTSTSKISLSPSSFGDFSVTTASTTLAFAAAEVPLRTLDQVRAGEALTHDVTGARGRARGLDLPERTPDEAAEIFWRTAEAVDFTLFEHFLADEAGHAKDMALAQSALGTFDAFARAVLRRRPADARVLVCSDHGNVEDLRTRNHTLGPVALLSFPPLDGARAPETVADVAGLIAGAGR